MTSIWQPVAWRSTFVITGSEGLKRVCVVLRDFGTIWNDAYAGRYPITVDTSEPIYPSFTNIYAGLTQSATQPSSGAATVTSAVDSLSSVTYQCFGGQYGDALSDCGTSTSLAAFSLRQNGTNTIGVRARDAAWNTSAGTLLAIVHDDTAPSGPPTVSL